MKKLLCLFALLGVCTAAGANEKVIRLNNVSDPNAEYAIAMLRLALSHIDEEYRIEINTQDLTQSRVEEEVRLNGKLNLLFTSSGGRLEEDLRPIRIPLFKGLLGYRIFIINEDNQHRFDNITTLEQLKKVSVGQGRTWGDTFILKTAGFNVITTTKYDGLFYMVEGGRFDAFPRGVHEPFVELAARPEMELAIEKNLMLAYKMPFYFFASKESEAMAQDIERGLNAAIANGSFDEAFMNARAVQDVIQKANMKNRRVFHIDNPLLPPETPLEREELWFDPSTL
jgi:hypothetical protein